VTGDYEDGNTLAGPLSEIFTVDVTTVALRVMGHTEPRPRHPPARRMPGP
jgi:Family of unknown function (DUF6510)